MDLKNSNLWKEVMVEEIDVLDENGAWDIVEL